MTVKSEIKKVIVEFGDGIASTGLGFSMIRGGLRIDPLVLVKGSLLHGEVRGMDEEYITLAISNPHVRRYDASAGGLSRRLTANLVKIAVESREVVADGPVHPG